MQAKSENSKNEWAKYVLFPVCVIGFLCTFALCLGFDGHMLMAAVGSIAAITGFRYGIKWNARKQRKNNHNDASK